jgi:hypothetical protein
MLTIPPPRVYIPEDIEALSPIRVIGGLQPIDADCKFRSPPVRRFTLQQLYLEAQLTAATPHPRPTPLIPANAGIQCSLL